MSRNAPFPTLPNRRPRSPPPLDAPSYPNGLPPTQPLSISRSRPRSPSNSPSIPPVSQSYTAPPAQPLRPARSERRPRQPPSVTGYGGPPSLYNNPPSSSRGDASGSSMLNNGYSPAGRQSPLPGRAAISRDRSNTMNTQSSKRTDDDPYGGMDTVASSPSTESPKALGAVIAAFQQAGTTARRKNTGGSEGLASDRELERQREKERRDRVLQRDRKQKRQATSGIDAVLDDVEQEWADVIEEDFNAVPLALVLLDESSLGRDIDSFRHTKLSLANTLKGSVDKNYQAFAHSVAHHANLLNSLTKAQAELADARMQLVEARDALGNRRADLIQLWGRGQTLDEMMRLLDEIERLKSVPDTLESLISEKRLLHAAVLLVKSLKTISKPDMLDIGAVADLRSYLTTQESSLRDILVEELHSHLYLKTFWCDRRWSSYTPNQTSFTAPEFDKIPGSNNQAVPSSRMEVYLNHLALRPSNESPAELFEDISDAPGRAAVLLASTSSYLLPPNDHDTGVNPEPRNPESDSFTYIEMLLEALAVLGKLVGALDSVIQRMPTEIFALVDNLVDEVSERSEFLRLAPGNGAAMSVAAGSSSVSKYIYAERRPTEQLASSLRLTALEASAKETHRETLRDLFWTLYSKLNAVLQGFRVTYEVSNRIGKRRDFKDSSGIKPGSLFPLLEIWIPLQNEVTSLLSDYLRDDDQLVISGRNPIASINEVLRSASQAREKIKASFRFGDTDAKISSKLLRKQDDELSKVLKETVPGLVTSGPVDGASVAPLSAVVSLDDRSSVGSGHHHRLLITPDALHVTVLFQPTLAWLASVNAAFPTSLAVPITETQSLLDRFVLNIYLPQLEEKVQTLFKDIVSAPDAFHEDPGWKNLSTAPLIKAITNLIALVNSMCAMMRVTPFHHENYSRLILGIIMQFYQRCSDRFQSLTTRTPTMPGVVADPSQFLTPAAWAQRSDLVKCFVSLLSSSPDDKSLRRSLCQEETRLELSALGGSVLSVSDSLGSPRSLSFLANLYQSLVWLGARLASLRKITEDAESPTAAGDQASISPSVQSPTSPVTDSDELSLPLSRAMAMRLDSLLKIYDQLVEIVLFTIRTDVRCRVFHYLQRGLREDLYHIDQEAQDPDLYVAELNAELATCDNAISTTLGDRERRFVFAGLGSLMEHLLIREARHVRSMNDAGGHKMLRNTSALRQCLKAIDVVDPADAELEAAQAYYSLFPLGPSGLLDAVRSESRFSFEEYKVMLSLQNAVNPMAADKLPPGVGGDFALHLIELQTICVE